MNPPMWDFPKHQSWSSHLVQDAQHSSKRHLHGDNRHVYATTIIKRGLDFVSNELVHRAGLPFLDNYYRGYQ